MRLLITTLGRVNRQITMKNLKGIEREFSLVVQQHEYTIHRKTYPGYDILCLPQSVTNLGATRKYLCEKYSDEKLVLLDDDLTFFWRPDPLSTKLQISPPAILNRMWNEIEVKLKDFAHVGMSIREFGNQYKGTESNPDAWYLAKRYMRVLCYNLSLFPRGIEIGRVDGTSDLDVALQLHRKGCPSAVTYRYAHNHPGTQEPGGCSLTRTKETHEAEIEKLVEWHKDFVLPHPHWLKGERDGFEDRNELKVYWQRAFNSSGKGRIKKGVFQCQK